MNEFERRYGTANPHGMKKLLDKQSPNRPARDKGGYFTVNWLEQMARAARWSVDVENKIIIDAVNAGKMVYRVHDEIVIEEVNRPNMFRESIRPGD